nr:M20/M25/M40 family metallo-hydrolase [Caulobacter sp.]
VGAAAPPEVFSTGRALKDIAVIAARPHPTGSAANRQVRDYLLGRMTAMGLSPVVQRADVVDAAPDEGSPWIGGARVENLIGVLPGRDRKAPALLLMAHYDSVAGSPGAADDATGVATILETVRALKVRGTPARDVLVLLTDGEEWGLIGAKAFFADHSLSQRVGLILNFESRGGGGRANMFETGRDNGGLIEVFKASARQPVSSALAVFLYEKMPNDTDFTVPKAVGTAGLNFAFIGRQFDYHSPTSTLANLDRGSVQSMGDQALAAAGDLAFAPALPARKPSAVYSQTFGDHVMAYPVWAGWLVLLGIGLLLGLAGWRARSAGQVLAISDQLRGAAGGLLILTGSALLLNLARRATGAGFGFIDQRPLLAQWPLWEACLVLCGLVLVLAVPALAARRTRRWPAALAFVVLGGLSSLAGGFDPVGLGLGLVSAGLAAATFGAPVERSGAWSGLLILGLILALLLQLFAPPTAFLVAWPLGIAALGAVLTRWDHDGGLASALALLAAVVGGWLGVYVHLTAQGLDLPAMLGVFSLLLSLTLWPLAAAAPSHRIGLAPALACLAAALVLLGLIRSQDPWSVRYPQIGETTFVADPGNGQAWRTTGRLNAWSRRAIAPRGGEISEVSLPPFADRPVFAAPAPPVDLPGPTLSHVRTGDRMVVTLTPQPGVRVMRINLHLKGKVSDLKVQGRPTAAAPALTAEGLKLRWTGDGAPLVLSWKIAGAGAAQMEYGALAETWPAAAAPLPPRPAEVMTWGMSDSTAIIGRETFRW